jgi:hypothetical protein
MTNLKIKTQMHKIHKKTTATLIVLLLIISMSASVILIPNASAHTPAWNIVTYAYIQVVPNPIGVGQTANVYMWLTNTYDSELITNNYRFQNYQLTITAPDGTVSKQTFPVVTDTTSNQFYSWTPTETGTYSFNFTFPGQTLTTSNDLPTSAYINDTYLPSSAVSTCTVQQQQITNYPQAPLPTEYWTHPIYGENTYWPTISSNWLGTGSAGYGTGAAGCNYPPVEAVGPQTSHVMWTYQIDMGGIVGGFGGQGIFFEGSAYNARFTNPILIDGYLYYTLPVSFTGTSTGATVCQDLRTGQIIWSTTQIPALSFGYIYDLNDPDQHGVYPPILFTANFAQAFDAYTGDPLFNVTGVPTGTAVVGSNGEQLKLILTNNGNATNPVMYLSEWNSSRLWETWMNPWTNAVITSPTLYNDSTTTGASLTTTQAQYASVTQPAISAPAGNGPTQPATSNYVIYGNVINPSSSLYSYDWNTSLSWLNTVTPVPTIVAAWAGNLMLLRSGTTPALTGSQTPYTYYAVNLNASVGTVGSMLWSNTVQPPAGNITVSYSGPASSDPTNGVFCEFYKETMQFVGYSLATGHQLWGPVGNQSQDQLMYYNSGYNSGGNENGAAYAYGRIYYDGFGGQMSCYDQQTGNLLWIYGNGGSGNTTSSGFETPGPYPMSIMAIGNGIVYTTTTEHTVEDPIYKGATQQAINATDGKLIWSLNEVTSEAGSPFGALETGAIADGYSVSLNGYDNSIYSVGKGTSATTVTAPAAGLAFGQSVVISGTVIDTSAGTKQTQQAANFPSGVPCASDESMSTWMSYVYQQQPIPTDFTGVQVQLYILDSNNNYRPIGTATTDASGTYRTTWTPDIAGNFTVYANFIGTQGYWPSSAETGFTVMNAPTSTVAPTATPTSVSDTYFVPAIAGLFVAIIVVGALLAILLLRKRP